MATPSHSPATSINASGQGPTRRQLGLPSSLRPSAVSSLGQLWYNLCVWLPALAGRRTQSVLVRYSGLGEYRTGPSWRIPLPKQCWKSAATEHLLECPVTQDVRCFVAPISTAVLTLLVAGTAFGLGLYFPKLTYNFTVVGIFALVGGSSFIFARSWTEQVSLSFWSKLEYAKDVKAPAMVLHENELYVFLPNAQLAEATREAIKAKRREGSRYAEEIHESRKRPSKPESPPNTDSAMPGSISHREQLPSIRLDE